MALIILLAAMIHSESSLPPLALLQLKLFQLGGRTHLRLNMAGQSPAGDFKAVPFLSWEVTTTGRLSLSYKFNSS
jgi:hypothetical protein